MAVTKTELKSSFLKDIVESEEHKASVQSIQDWLTGQTQLAQQQYQQTAQTAATQASYDISGAYANYLKQQRSIASQGRLESGYKEELGDVLKSQYGSAYQQARATQAENVASAAETYAKNVSQYSKEASEAAQSYYESAIKEAEIQANIYKAAEEYAGFTEDSQYPLYELINDKYQLTDYGFDVMSSKILDAKGGFKSYLEEQGLTDELDYYLSNPQGIHEKLFGITDTAYDQKSEESYKRRLGAVSKEGVSYIDTIEKPQLELNFNDFADWDFGESGFDKYVGMADELTTYATQSLGLTKDEIRQALGFSDIKVALAQSAYKLNDWGLAKEEFNKTIKKLDDVAKKKYQKE